MEHGRSLKRLTAAMIMMGIALVYNFGNGNIIVYHEESTDDSELENENAFKITSCIIVSAPCGTSPID